MSNDKKKVDFLLLACIKAFMSDFKDKKTKKNKSKILEFKTKSLKEQKIETEELALQLKAMIEIVKQWETFDMEEYQREMEAALKQAMKS